MLEEFPYIKKEDFSSYYISTKNRPNIDALLFAADVPLPGEEQETPDDINETNNVRDPVAIPLCRPVVDEEDTEINHGMVREENMIEGARIEGGYTNVIDRLRQKFIDANIELTGKVMFMDCFDGAEHVKTKKKNVSLISFNTVMTCKSAIKAGKSRSTSFGILTVQTKGDGDRR